MGNLDKLPSIKRPFGTRFISGREGRPKIDKVIKPSRRIQERIAGWFHGKDKS